MAASTCQAFDFWKPVSALVIVPQLGVCFWAFGAPGDCTQPGRWCLETCLQCLLSSLCVCGGGGNCSWQLLLRQEKLACEVWPLLGQLQLWPRVLGKAWPTHLEEARGGGQPQPQALTNCFTAGPEFALWVSPDTWGSFQGRIGEGMQARTHLYQAPASF